MIPVLMIGLLLLSCTFAAGCLRESVLSVRGMSVGAEAVDPSRVTLNVTTEIENHEGFGGGTPRLQLRAFNTETGILEVERTDTIGDIGWGASRSLTQTLVLPRKGSYRLVSTLFEGEKRKAQGEITVYNLDRLIPDNLQTGLALIDIDFIAREVHGDSVDLQTDLYLRNDDPAPSGSFQVEVKAKEQDAHLVADKKSIPVDSIEPGKIVVASVLLTVPDQYNYQMEVLIWKEGTIIKRGEGSVQLRPGTTLSAGDTFVTRSIETSRFVSEQGYDAPVPYVTPPVRTPGFSAILALAAFAVAALAGFRWRRRR